jgi:hypothetical protein
MILERPIKHSDLFQSMEQYTLRDLEGIVAKFIVMIVGDLVVRLHTRPVYGQGRCYLALLDSLQNQVTLLYTNYQVKAYGIVYLSVK